MAVSHGSQYTSLGLGKRCRKAGVRPSMGSVGDAYDSAMCESFFAARQRRWSWSSISRRDDSARCSMRLGLTRIH
jgi:putative transposase